METCNFIACITRWEWISTCLHRASRKLQATSFVCVNCIRSTRWAAASVVLGRVSCCPPTPWMLSWKLIRVRIQTTGQNKNISPCVASWLKTDRSYAFFLSSRSILQVVDIAVDQFEWCFEGQRQVARMLTFIFSETMLSLMAQDIYIYIFIYLFIYSPLRQKRKNKYII